MHLASLVVERGGVATTAELREHATKREIAAAVADGTLTRLAHGLYGGRGVRRARAEAKRLGGTVCLLSAAREHGWSVPKEPAQPQICVPRNRKVTARQRRGVELHYSDARGEVTEPEQTLLACIRRYPFRVGLSIADSALRLEAFTADELADLAGRAKGPGSRRIREVVAAADGRAANAFESCLRTICLTVPELSVQPQVPIELPGVTVHPDLVDVRLGLVVEADGWFSHASTPDRFARDLWRYGELIAEGWTVLRFGWRHVMEEPDWVRDVLRRTLACRKTGTMTR